jgi:UDP-N-acetylglucosamine 4,6-dehydratase/5-epimerase
LNTSSGREWTHGECLITGGSGFLGSYLVKELLGRYPDIRIKVISRSESEIAGLLALCSEDKRVLPIVGDIKDTATLGYALQGTGSVFHLAAMKHIDLCETNTTEAISINVLATMNILKMFGGDVFISMSTDKAVASSGCYGATKQLLEKLTMERARMFPGRRYMVVRSGNIFGSTGSVIPKWVKQIKDNNKITVTDQSITRFFLDVDTLVSFMIEVIELGRNGKVYIPRQYVLSLRDLINATIKAYGNSGTKLETTGLREGEKTHERLFFAEERNLINDRNPATSDEDGHRPGENIADTIDLWIKKYVA